ncbi:MAG TPA: aspartyl/asparaginyl beta-hydroxylase domain-containing protein [Balneolales bacterium]|nr:aspartyl/asparaginyl beta-hydroxylase domain-containing protein [Balneolales bacterium]
MKDLGGKVLWTLEKLIANSSKVPNTPFFDSNLFDWTKHLELNHKIIKEELEDILSYLDQIPNFQEISSDQNALTQDDKWKTYFLYGFGYKEKKLCSLSRNYQTY